MATERGIVFVVDAESGETIWRKRFPGVFTASPVVANDHVYITSEEGTTFVLGGGREPSVEATNRVGERTLASPAISGGQIFLRTDHSLLAIGRVGVEGQE